MGTLILTASLAAATPAPKERADAAFDAFFDEGSFAYMNCAFAQHGKTRYSFARKADPEALATNKNTRKKDFDAPFDAGGETASRFERIGQRDSAEIGSQPSEYGHGDVVRMNDDISIFRMKHERRD